MTQESLKTLLQQYGVGPIQFSGTNDALYERHLTFDHVIDVKKASVREQFEAAARAFRDVISQRWLRTEQTYAEKNPKRVYYLSMEYLLGRSFANNMTNALLRPLAAERQKQLGLVPAAALAPRIAGLRGHERPTAQMMPSCLSRSISSGESPSRPR